MADIATSRVEPTIERDTLAEPAASASAALRDAVETHPVEPVSTRTEYAGGDQLSRIEEKTARIEEKYARSEALIQRMADKVDVATGRMGEVALQADLRSVRDDLNVATRRLRSLPGLSSLVFTAIVTALLTSAVTVALLKYLPLGLGIR